MNDEGEIIDDEKENFGHKSTMNIERYDFGIVLDECGCKILQEGDCKIVRQLYLNGVKISSQTKRVIFNKRMDSCL